MSNRTVEAVLKISSKLGDMKALKTLQSELRKVETQAKTFNRANVINKQLRGLTEAHTNLVRTARFVGPAAAGYGAKRAFEQFAETERGLTRTGLKIGATRKDMDALKVTAQQVAQRYAVANAAVYETIDAYSETGAELRDIKSDIDTIVKAQQAMGAEGRDIVGSWDAARKNFGVMSSDAERFFDILAKGSATGKFEGSDLAQYLPSILPIAGVQGLSGLSGTAQVVGALEAMRDRTGTSETAATAMTDFLDKLNSPLVQKNFKKMNIDLPKAMKEARENGEDFFSAMSKILNKATKGDVAKLGFLFGERDSRNFARMLLTDIDDVEERIRVLREESKGTIALNVKIITEDAEASIDRLTNSFGNLTNSAGALLDRFGASNALDAVANDLDRMNAAIKGGWTPLQSLVALLSGENPSDAVDEAAWKGGRRTPEELMRIEGYGAWGTRMSDTGPQPTYGVAIGPDGVPYPVPWRNAPNGPAGDKTTNAVPFYTDSRFRDVPPELRPMASRIPGGELFTGGFESPEALRDAIGGGGEQAGQSIQEAAEQLNRAGGEAGAAIRAQLSGMDALFDAYGARAAQSFKNNLGTVNVRVNADVGRSGADVDAGGP